jgi:serine/threonine-protein kinase HipA
MRSGRVYYKDILAGILTETDDGEYSFRYDEKYVKHHKEDFIAFSMPVRSEEYKNKRLLPFFEGLIPEGWLLDIATKNWKLKADDRMGLLLACCQNCIGAVSIININTDDGE